MPDKIIGTENKLPKLAEISLKMPKKGEINWRKGHFGAKILQSYLYFAVFRNNSHPQHEVKIDKAENGDLKRKLFNSVFVAFAHFHNCNNDDNNDMASLLQL